MENMKMQRELDVWQFAASPHTTQSKGVAGWIEVRVDDSDLKDARGFFFF